MTKFTRYVTLGRMAWNYWIRKVKPDYLPMRLWVEPTSVCNLRCVMCPQSFGRRFAKGYMEFSLFKKIIDEAKTFVYDVNLHHTGEPTLHPRLPEMIRYAKESGIYTRLHTNATLLNEERARALLTSGLDLISFSFDGYEKEEYEKIRVRSDFDETLGNILNFLHLKKKLGQTTPYTIFEVIDFSGEARDAERQKKFRAQFAGLPLDQLIIKEPHNWAGSYEIKDHVPSYYTDYYSPCTFPWYALVIFWNGKVAPCPQDFYGDLDMGDVNKSSIKEIWNSAPMMELRRLMKEGRGHDLSPCSGCDMIKRKTFLGVPTLNLKTFLKESVLGYKG
ncbi:MAG TPA: radical SAM protein [Candidatus Limnocylindrales bacterium]|nr:radical SAM protein [Candidatus Limnocylindrales bacterium]